MRISTEVLYVGEVNATGTDVITFRQNRYAGGEAICIRDVTTGRVLLDLADVGVKRGDLAGWHSQNGNLLATVSADSAGKVELIEVQLRPHVEIVRRNEIDIANLDLDVVMSDPNGDLRYGIVKRHNDLLSRPHFKIVNESGSILRQVDFGRDETVYLNASADGSIIMAHFRAQGIGDNVYTDGSSNGVLHLDAISGETLRQYQGGFVEMWHGEEFVALPNNGGSYDVVNIDRPDEAVLKLGKGIPLRIDDDTLAVYEDGAVATLTMFQLGSNQSPSVTTLPTWGEAQLMSSAVDGKMFVVTNGLLQRMDISTGQVTNLFTVRPWFETARAIALAGMPLFAIVWLTFSFRSRDISPMLEVAFVMFAYIAVLVYWTSVPSAREYNLHYVMETAVYALIGAIVPVGLVWVSTLRSVWAEGIPIVTLAGAALLACFVAWRGGGEAILFVSVASLFIVCFSSGLRFLPASCRVEQPISSADEPMSGRQFSVKQTGIIIASFAVLFLAMRSIQWADVQFDAVAFAWFGMTTPWMAVVMLMSVGTGLRHGNAFFSLLLWAGLTAVLMGTHIAITSMFAPAMLRRDPPVQLIGVVGAFLVFAAMRWSFSASRSKSIPFIVDERPSIARM